MANRFGGIPVEEQAAQPSGNRFGGVPVEPNAPKSEPPQSKGFLGELWNEVKNGPANLAKVGDVINNAVLHPYETAKAMGQPMLETAGKARDAWKAGDYKKAVREGLNTGINAVLPGVGSSSSEAGDMYDRGDIAGGTGKTIGIGANLVIGGKAPQIAKTVGTAAAETITPGVRGPIGRMVAADPRVAGNRALRPIPSDPNFPKRTPATLRAIKKANDGKAPTGITDGELDMVGATNRAIAEHQGALDQWITRAKGVRVNGDELVAATRDAIPQMMWERDPAGARALIQDAQNAFGGKTYTVEQFRDFLRSDNGDLSSFYRKAPGAQADASVAGTPTAIQEAQTGRIREVLYKALDPEGAGAGPRTIQNKTGDLIKWRNTALQRTNAIVAEQPISPVERVLSPIKRHLPLLRGDATGLSFSQGQAGRSMPLLKRAFKAVGDEPVNALPLPGSPLYPTGNPARQLGQGGFTGGAPGMSAGQVQGSMPGMHPSRGMTAPDVSGGGAVPGMYPTGPNPARALPPASTRFAGPPGAEGAHPTTSASPLRAGQGPTLTPESPTPPADTSSVRSVPGQRQVPQAEPSVIPPSQTGRVIDMNTRPAPHGAGADAEWWAQQPPTRPEIQARYQELFSKAENLSPQRPVAVPETGIPEGVARGADARGNIAAQVLKGKPLEQATPTELNVIDQLIAEGYGSAPPRRFAKGGWAGLRGEEKIIVGDGGEPEVIIPLSHIRMMGPQAQKHLLRGIGSHLGIGKPRKSTLGEELGGKRHMEKK
jgi:hypothetical protein